MVVPKGGTTIMILLRTCDENVKMRLIPFNTSEPMKHVVI